MVLFALDSYKVEVQVPTRTVLSPEAQSPLLNSMVVVRIKFLISSRGYLHSWPCVLCSENTATPSFLGQKKSVLLLWLDLKGPHP